jgi:hypothetical protein
VSQIKQFVTSVKAVTAGDELMEFEVDGEVLHCYPPKDGQVAILMASISRHTSVATKLAGIIDFFVEVMDEPSREYVVGRLMDRNDPFGLEEVEQISKWMMEELGGYPTQPPSVSTQSQKNGGRKSKHGTTKSNSSVSQPTAS